MEEAGSNQADESRRCGLVMPLSAIDSCPEHHWVDVRSILSEAIQQAGFTPNMVSAADEVGIIQTRIIQNLYENPIVVCDVSAKNPNVMFELGMRLAFDKPTIIIKDDETSYSFDTAPIEHLEYPRDLRFPMITKFQKELADKIKKPHHRSSQDPDYSAFLKHFGKFTVAAVETSEVSKEVYLLEEIRELKSLVRHSLQQRSRDRRRYHDLWAQEKRPDSRSDGEVIAGVRKMIRNYLLAQISASGESVDHKDLWARARREIFENSQSMQFMTQEEREAIFERAYIEVMDTLNHAT